MKEEFPGETYKEVRQVGHRKGQQVSKGEISGNVTQRVASD